MKNKVAAIFVSVVSIIAGIKLISYFWWKTYAIDDTAVINEGTAGVGMAAFMLLGALVYFVVSKLKPDWSDDDSKQAGTWTVVGVLESNMCASGTCQAAAVISTVYTIPALLCVLLGAAGIKYYKETRKL